MIGSQKVYELFKTNYKKEQITPFLSLFARLDEFSDEKKIIAIEGGSASGKTTLAEMLQRVYDCTVFHMDDFFLRPQQRTPERYSEIGGNIDRERFLAEVLEPLSRGKEINYQRFDCSKMALDEIEHIVPKKLVIVEGAYSMHPEFERFYDFSVFLNISAELQKKRILKRNSPLMAERFFNEWIPLEQKYFSHFNIPKKCGLEITIIE